MAIEQPWETNREYFETCAKAFEIAAEMQWTLIGDEPENEILGCMASAMELEHAARQVTEIARQALQAQRNRAAWSTHPGAEGGAA